MEHGVFMQLLRGHVEEWAKGYTYVDEAHPSVWIDSFEEYLDSSTDMLAACDNEPHDAETISHADSVEFYDEGSNGELYAHMKSGRVLERKRPNLDWTLINEPPKS